jgi:hypothetical protein
LTSASTIIRHWFPSLGGGGGGDNDDDKGTCFARARPPINIACGNGVKWPREEKRIYNMQTSYVRMQKE